MGFVGSEMPFGALRDITIEYSNQIPVFADIRFCNCTIATFGDY